MKTAFYSLLFAAAVLLHAHGGERQLPDQSMQKQFEWAQSADTPKEQALRLNAFWTEYLPQEDGGSNPNRVGYEDGSHVCAIIVCAWQLTRAYIKAGESEKAIEMMDWLAEHESKTSLAPYKPKPNKRMPAAGVPRVPDP